MRDITISSSTLGWIIKMKNYILLMALSNWDASWQNNSRTFFSQNLKKKIIFTYQEIDLKNHIIPI